MKLKKALSSLLALVLLVSCMSITAFADGETITVTSTMTEWSTAGTYVVNQDTTINGSVTVSADVKLEIAANTKLTIKSPSADYPGIAIGDCTLTIDSYGTLDVYGGDTSESSSGSDGILFTNINSAMIIDKGTVYAHGGTGEYSQGVAINRSTYIESKGVTVNNGELHCGSQSATYAIFGVSLVLNDGLVEMAANVTSCYLKQGCTLQVNGGILKFSNCQTSIGFYGDNTLLSVNGGQVYTVGDFVLAGSLFGTTYTVNTSITGGLFNTDVTSYLDTTAYKCIANADPATKGSYGYIVLPVNHYQLVSASGLTGKGGVEFTVGGSQVISAAQNAAVTATAIAVDGYVATTLSASDNATNFNASAGTFTMPDGAVTVTATYATAKAITNGAPQANEETNHGYITVSAESAKANAEITVTAYPEDGYKLDSLTYTPDGGSATAITGGKFNMPDKAVTVNATFSQIVTSGTIDLDLEESDTYPESTTIDQYYTKVEASSTVDTHRIGVTWWTDAYTTLGHNNLVVQVNKAVKWDPTTLSWVEDEALNGVASVQEGTDKVNFKLSNYSSKAFTCEISYAKNTEDTLANKDANTVVFDSNNGGTLAKVENDINKPGETNSAYLDGNEEVDLTKVPTLTITGTVGVDLDGFKNADANSTAVKYGAFTISCTAVTE